LPSPRSSSTSSLHDALPIYDFRHGLPDHLHQRQSPGWAACTWGGRHCGPVRRAVASGHLLVIDGGVLGNVPPSTLVDCTGPVPRSEEHTSELQSRENLVCRL